MALSIDYLKSYASAPDDSLVRWSKDVSSLVPSARQALKAEMERRKIGTEDVNWSTEAAKPMRVTGWLWFYCFGAIIITPVWFISIIFHGRVFVSLCVLPSIVLTVGSGLLLWRLNPAGLRWARRNFLYVGACAFLMLPLTFLVGGLMFGIDYIVDMIFTLIPLMLWWSYFRKSNQVRELYGRNMEGLRPAKAKAVPEVAADAF